MLGSIDRYIKQAIVDRNPLVSSSALVSGMNLFKKSPEIIRKWVNEVQEALNSPHEMVQYHALSLLYSIKKHDKLAVSKVINASLLIQSLSLTPMLLNQLVSTLSRSGLRSPLAMCLLIRYTSKLLQEDLSATDARAAYQFLESCLRQKNEVNADV